MCVGFLIKIAVVSTLRAFSALLGFATSPMMAAYTTYTAVAGRSAVKGSTVLHCQASFRDHVSSWLLPAMHVVYCCCSLQRTTMLCLYGMTITAVWKAFQHAT
jgi:hypothetical protein